MLHADLHLDPNEASDLTRVPEGGPAHGWDRAFATVLDEAPAEESVALIVHAAGAPLAEGWRAIRVTGTPSQRAGKTEDAEACAVRDGMLYVAGSQFGSKDGPLEPSRSFLARVRIDDLLESAAGGGKPKMDVAWLRMGLHRAINDALARATVDLLPLGPETRERYIDATIRGAAADDKRWSGRVRSDDHPVNVEAMSFRADGRALLGLRHPVTAEGAPLFLELDDVDAAFADPDTVPRCSSVWWLEGVGSPEEPVGLRALHDRGTDAFDAVVGNLDAAGKGSALIADRPEAAAACSTHVRFTLPAAAAGGAVACEIVRAFEDVRRVEGVVTDADNAFYVIDEEGQVALRALAIG